MAARLDEFVDLWSLMADDERRTMIALAKRLMKGQEQYGRLSIVGDARDWHKEMREEMLDLVIYAAFQKLKEES